MTIRDLLLTMEDNRKEALLAIYDEYRELFHHAMGSAHNHQAWVGGYADHIAECMRVNRLVYPVLNEFRELPFTVGQADFCLFFHDIEKPFRYGFTTHPGVQRYSSWMRARQRASGQMEPQVWESLKWDIFEDLTNRYAFDLYQDERNALKYTHGEGHDHDKYKRVAGPLAAHVHHCDNTSARIWHDEGRGLG